LENLTEGKYPLYLELTVKGRITDSETFDFKISKPFKPIDKIDEAIDILKGDSNETFPEKVKEAVGETKDYFVNGTKSKLSILGGKELIVGKTIGDGYAFIGGIFVKIKSGWDGLKNKAFLQISRGYRHEFGGASLHNILNVPFVPIQNHTLKIMHLFGGIFAILCRGALIKVGTWSISTKQGIFASGTILAGVLI
jgi:hypothetical protein